MGRVATIGLRERKKRQTRERIIVAGIELFAERGFKETTVADIAAAVDIAPSTFYGYFTTKDELMFQDQARGAELLEQKLESRPGTKLTLDVLQEYAQSVPQDSPEERRIRKLRYQVVASEPSLQGPDHSSYADAIRPVLLAAYGKDLGGADADDVRVRLLTALTIGAMMEVVYIRREAVLRGTVEVEADRFNAACAAMLNGLETAYATIVRGESFPSAAPTYESEPPEPAASPLLLRDSLADSVAGLSIT